MKLLIERPVSMLLLLGALTSQAQVTLLENQPPDGTYPQALFQGGCVAVNNDYILCGGIDCELYRWDGQEYVLDYKNEAVFTEVALGDAYFAMAPWSGGWVYVHSLSTHTQVEDISVSMPLTYVDPGDHMAFCGSDLALFMSSSEIRVYTNSSGYTSYETLSPPGGMSFSTALGSLDADDDMIATLTTTGRAVTYQRNAGSWVSPIVDYTDEMTLNSDDPYFINDVAVHDGRLVMSATDVNGDYGYIQLYDWSGTDWTYIDEHELQSVSSGVFVAVKVCFDGDQVYVSDVDLTGPRGVVRIFNLASGTLTEVTPSPYIDENSTGTTYYFGNDGMDAGDGVLAIGDPSGGAGSIGTYWFYRTHHCVELEIQTDNDPTETTWTISGNGATVSGGGGAYTGLANSTIIETITLPAAPGCYSLEVEDSGGDGMTSGSNGGYILRTCTGERIIDNDQDGFFNSISTANCANDFCLPLGPITMDANSCDMDPYILSRGLSDHCDIAGDGVISAFLDATITAACSSDDGYRYQILDPDGMVEGQFWNTPNSPFNNCVIADNGSIYCTSRLHTYNNWAYGATGPLCERYKFVNPNSWVGNIPPINVWLNIRVARVLNGVQEYYGPVCRIRFVPPDRRPLADASEDGVDVELPRLKLTPVDEANSLIIGVHSLASPDGVAVIEVRDMQGKSVAQERFATNGLEQWSADIDMPELASGLYVVSVTTSVDQVSTRLFTP